MATSSSIPSDLSSLTVPQLKALCKERRIARYSKLGKGALLQQLYENAAPANATRPSKDRASLGTGAPLPLSHADNPRDTIDAHLGSEPSGVRREERTVQLERTTAIGLEALLPTILPTSSSNPKGAMRTVTTPLNVAGTKRPAHIIISAPPKRIRTSLPFGLKSTVVTGGCELAIPNTPTPGQTPFATSANHNKASDVTKQSSVVMARSNGTVPHRIPGSGRFRPLTISRLRLPLRPDREDRRNPPTIVPCTTSKAVDSALLLKFPIMPVPPLFNISLPPKASERRKVHRWAIILSALSGEDRQACCLVSRTLRYAVYLSAAHILSRHYPGRRLDAVLEQYPQNMTNFWPYLRLRTDEAFARRQAFKRSFLGRYTDSLSYDPLSGHLWASPDDEKQVEIALRRFVLTRMWFAVSIGAYGHDSSAWTKTIVKNVREVVKDEIWRVDVQYSSTTEAFYVLEATCEVIGHPPSLEQNQMVAGHLLRADWTAYIIGRLSQSSPPAALGRFSLLGSVRWSNSEDYCQGISKVWLYRVSDQDEGAIAKRGVAEKYILASVVANGISGRWMSTSAMAQEFAGLPGNDNVGSRATAPPVNMYLPTHHHVESVHFTTSKGKDLHPAVAVVQTSAREYYILRENGMQVGCEEDGVAEVWQQILHCDSIGRAL
ncbi:hypothetical protein BU15DRAFT_43896 [Melanogaster broomeanus]|nr:hypothetical protein BU15DRAFT_43896 [Melanogaster broomeanus]